MATRGEYIIKQGSTRISVCVHYDNDPLAAHAVLADSISEHEGLHRIIMRLVEKGGRIQSALGGCDANWRYHIALDQTGGDFAISCEELDLDESIRQHKDVWVRHKFFDAVRVGADKFIVFAKDEKRSFGVFRDEAQRQEYIEYHQKVSKMSDEELKQSMKFKYPARSGH